MDDSLFLGTWTDKQSSIPYHDVCDAGLDFVGFFSLRSDMSAIGCGDGIREEGLRDDYLELKFYTVLDKKAKADCKNPEGFFLAFSIIVTVVIVSI
ncbi:hypothetical protein TNCV_4778981 [Trichonephila clavipes]|nr:hypothetical protein TNCV_4778981 [Trichonephila clavipes]